MDNSGSESEIEYCIVCGEETKYKKSDHVDQRINYIEGAGQLCSRCRYNQTFYSQNLR